MRNTLAHPIIVQPITRETSTAIDVNGVKCPLMITVNQDGQTLTLWAKHQRCKKVINLKKLYESELAVEIDRPARPVTTKLVATTQIPDIQPGVKVAGLPYTPPVIK